MIPNSAYYDLLRHYSGGSLMRCMWSHAVQIVRMATLNSDGFAGLWKWLFFRFSSRIYVHHHFEVFLTLERSFSFHVLIWKQRSCLLVGPTHSATLCLGTSQGMSRWNAHSWRKCKSLLLLFLLFILSPVPQTSWLHLQLTSHCQLLISLYLFVHKNSFFIYCVSKKEDFWSGKKNSCMSKNILMEATPCIHFWLYFLLCKVT